MESALLISSGRNLDVALVSDVSTVLEDDAYQRFDTIEHVDSDSDKLEVLEAEVNSARAQREEGEALERLAKARRAHLRRRFLLSGVLMLLWFKKPSLCLKMMLTSGSTLSST